MFETAVPLTLHLAAGLGLVLVAAGIGGFTGKPGADWAEAIDELGRMPGLTLAMAFIAIVFGAGILLVHHHWTDPLAIAVTLIGWAAFIEGLLLLAVPGSYLAFARNWTRYARPWALVALLLGAVLLVAGLTGRAVPVLV